MQKIARESAVWDLHIHTCQCPKASGEFGKLTVNEYVDKLIEIIKRYPDLKMISFTDHNQISVQVYNEFLSKNNNITVIPGIEVDLYLNKEDYEMKNNNYKHLIFYFDNERFNYDTHAALINEKLNNTQYIYDFLDFLITEIKDVSFLISPHFLKQDKRGLDFDWNDAGVTRKNINKYIDQLFCFWETSNTKNIVNAMEFLKEYDKEERVSIISFSDSNNFSKLEEYLKKPNQYFNALSNYEGLRMVGSDCRRIHNKKLVVNEQDKGKYIGKILQGTNVIELSERLNTIVGGRGSGKSILIDGIANYLDDNFSIKQLLNKNRIDFLNQLKFEVYNMNGDDLKHHNFKFDYFNQGYVLKLFEDNNDIVTSRYFKDEFIQMPDYDEKTTKARIIGDLYFTKELSTILTENIVSISTKNIILSSQKNDFKFPKMHSISNLDYKEYTELMGALNKPAITPKELLLNEKIIEAKNNLISVIYEEQYKYNYEAIKNNVNYYAKLKYKEKMDALSTERANKSKILNMVKEEMVNTSIPYINRVKIINNILSMNNIYSAEQKIIKDGFDNHKFIFVKKINVQNFLDYLFTVFNNYYDSNKLKSQFGIVKNDYSNLFELIKIYCYNLNKVLLESKTENEIDDEIMNLKSLKIVVSSDIYIFDGEKTISMRTLSPGTKANYLMEYIVFKDTNIPLIIDQPEDNIDNSTIYKVLTKWFEELKVKRQVIVATHDPNIVVNADSENIIVCNQTIDNVFEYNYGALEYKNNIETIATILDGGSAALERRLVKYGEN